MEKSAKLRPIKRQERKPIPVKYVELKKQKPLRSYLCQRQELFTRQQEISTR